MQIHTTARHCELHPDDRALANLRLEKCQRYARDLHEAHVVVTAEGFRYVVEITARLKRRQVAVREESTAPRHALELAADRLEEHLRRLHERRIDRKRSAVPDGLANGAADGAAEDDDADFDGLDGFEEV